VEENVLPQGEYTGRGAPRVHQGDVWEKYPEFSPSLFNSNRKSCMVHWVLNAPVYIWPLTRLSDVSRVDHHWALHHPIIFSSASSSLDCCCAIRAFPVSWSAFGTVRRTSYVYRQSASFSSPSKTIWSVIRIKVMFSNSTFYRGLENLLYWSR